MKKIISLLSKFSYIPLLLFIAMPVIAWAQSPTIQDIQVLQGFDNIFELLNALVAFLVQLASVLAALVIAWGGYQYFLSGLDESKKNGLKTVQAGIIGLVITLSATLIRNTVEQVFEGSDGAEIDSEPIRVLLNTIISETLIPIAQVLAVLVIIWGGYKYFFSGFDESKKDGLNTVKNGVIGLIVVSIANLLVNLVNSAIPTGEDGVQNLADIPQALGDQLFILIENSSSALSNIAGAFCILVIIWGGYKYFQGGFDGKAEGIKNIQRGVIGLVVILLANFITGAVTSIFGDIGEGDNLESLPDQFEQIVGPIITNGTNVLLSLAGLVSVLVIMYGGYQFFFATLPNSKANGKDTIIKGVIGLIVAIVARPIVTIIVSTIRASGPTDTESYLQFNQGSLVFTIQAFITNLLIPVSSIFAVFFMILGGYYWFTSNGNQEQIKKARTQVTNSLIAFVIILMSVTAVQLIIFFVQTDQFVEVENSPNFDNSDGETITIPNNTNDNSGNGDGNSNNTPFSIEDDQGEDAFSIPN